MKSRTISYASWDKWNPKVYLKTYFPRLLVDEDETLKFLVNALQKYKHKKLSRVLEFGSGPIVVHALVAAPYAKEVHIADYLEENLREVKRWLKKEKGSFDWSPFTSRILELEGLQPTSESILERADELRRKTTKLIRCDASLKNPLINSVSRYPLVISTYCMDSATSSKEVWRAYMKNVSNLVAPKGRILLAALRKCTSYRLGRFFYPSANIDEKDIRKVLRENGFSNIRVEVKNVAQRKADGYSSLLFAQAVKKHYPN